MELNTAPWWSLFYASKAATLAGLSFKENYLSTRSDLTYLADKNAMLATGYASVPAGVVH